MTLIAEEYNYQTHRMSGKEDSKCFTVLVIYYCITNHHRLYGVQQHSFVILQILWSGGWGSLAGFPISGSLTRLSFRRQPGMGSHLQLDWGSISFQAHMVVHSSWRVTGLRSLTPCRPLARGHPQFLALWTSLYGSLLHQSQRGRQSIQRVC